MDKLKTKKVLIYTSINKLCVYIYIYTHTYIYTYIHPMEYYIAMRVKKLQQYMIHRWITKTQCRARDTLNDFVHIKHTKHTELNMTLGE